MQKFPRRWNKLECVNFLQRKIILNAIAYYELDSPTLSDREYDELSMQLVNMQSTVNIKDTQYGYVFYDFDGSTGFDLYHRLNEHDKEYLMNIACHYLNSANIKKQKIKKSGGALF